MAVKEQRPAVKRMKKGSSFFGYTDTSWNAGATVRKRAQVTTSADEQEKTWWSKRMNHGLHVGFSYCTYRAVVPCLLFLCILGMGKTSDPSLVGRELSGRLERQKQIAKLIEMNNRDRLIIGLADYWG